MRASAVFRHAAQRGFTLIEMMIVVAIIGIASTLAVAVYQDYVVRAKLSEVIVAGSACRSLAQERASMRDANTGGIARAEDIGCDSATQTTKYVSSVVVADSCTAMSGTGSGCVSESTLVILTVGNTGNPAVDGRKILYQSLRSDIGVPTFGAKEGYAWSCGPTLTDGVPVKFLPSSCRQNCTERFCVTVTN